MKKDKVIYAKDLNCIECGRPAVALWPLIDPDIPAEPYCRECLDKAKMRILMECFGKSEKEAEVFVKLWNKKEE